MEGYKHFSHPHTLSFHKSLELGAQLTCTGCKFPCTDTRVYSCPECEFFLHDLCFNATRSLIHPSHPDHPLLLCPSPTYPLGSFRCDSCNKTGSGFSFCCPTCDFDIHIHCAYSTLKPKPVTPPPNEIKLKSHPDHPLKYCPNQPHAIGTRLCDVCGTNCDDNDAQYRCDVCDYDAHVTCTTLPESVHREDHPHALSLRHVNPYPSFECDVCKGAIAQNNCLYVCASDCEYGMHVNCVSTKVVENAPMDALTFQMEMLNLQNKMQMQQMVFEATNRFFRY